MNVLKTASVLLTSNTYQIITTGKPEIQTTVKTLLPERLEQEDIGLGIKN